MAFNPDFILEFIRNGESKILIFDAKYKKYPNSKILEADLSSLTYKYLHKIKFENAKVEGLFSISLGDRNALISIFKQEFQIGKPESIYPQIGALQLKIDDLNTLNNPIIDAISSYV